VSGIPLSKVLRIAPPIQPYFVHLPCTRLFVWEKLATIVEHLAPLLKRDVV